LQASYQNPNEASRTLGDLGYTLDESLSQPNAKVFVDKKGRPNIAFRGSQRAEDFYKSDLLLALGLDQYDSRFKEAKRLTKLVEDKYNKKVDTFGHSLGGSLAEKSGTNGHIYTFDKGTGIGDLFKTIPKKQYDIRNSNDIVSLGSVTQNHLGKFKEIENPNQGLLEAHYLNNLES
jgi:hypothetical protein